MADRKDFDFEFDVAPTGAEPGPEGDLDDLKRRAEEKRAKAKEAKKRGGDGNGAPAKSFDPWGEDDGGGPPAEDRGNGAGGNGAGEDAPRKRSNGKPAMPKAEPKPKAGPRAKGAKASKPLKAEKPADETPAKDPVEDALDFKVDPKPEPKPKRAKRPARDNAAGDGAEQERPKLVRAEDRDRVPAPGKADATDEGVPLAPQRPSIEETPPEPEFDESFDGPPEVDSPGRQVPPKGPRRIGGITLPAMPDLTNLKRNLRLPDVGAVSERGGGRPPIKIGRFQLPTRRGGGNRPYKKGRVKKWRLMIILAGLGLLAMVSSIFGIMMAVANDLPDLENRTEYEASENSVVYDIDGNKVGTLTSNNNRILVESEDIAQSMKQAVVAIEDQRFYEHRGVDFKGIGRAVFADLMPGGSTQGASTITQQFVKNALEAQSSRTVFQKLRESALAYHLERRWDKDKILTQYLNTIYFGEGAYGIEAAARTYFSSNHPECGTDGQPRCASLLEPAESAMLAGIISSPSAYSPRSNPNDAAGRRNLVLDKMVEQNYMTGFDAEEAKQTPLPSASSIEPPAEDSISPYFTSWLRQQLVDRYGAGKAFAGGLRVKTTLDLDLQEAVEGIVANTLAPIEPTGSIVVLDRKTGGVRAMVGGLDYEEKPFNLATNGHRQPGSAFKPFTLATALANGHSPSETYTSAEKTFIVPGSGGKEEFEVHNYEDIYYGASDLASATIHSDNSVFQDLGYHIVKDPQQSFNKIENTANEMGIATDITPNHKANPALVLGGLIQGVTPLEMAFAYNTLANDGEKVSGTLAAYNGGPVAIEEVTDKDGKTIQGGDNKPKTKRILSEDVANTTTSMLSGVVGSGTGKRAQNGMDTWGKTGTTDNNGDAWFCGSAGDEFTACVWVGHPDSIEPMETEFAGQPVDGGTYPALMFAQVANAWANIEAAREAGDEGDGTSDTSSSGSYVPPVSSGTTSGGGGGSEGAEGPATSAPPAAGGGGGGGGAPTGGGTSGGIGAGL